MPCFWEIKEKRGKEIDQRAGERESPDQREHLSGPLQCQVGLFMVGEVA
jgi:hypothetical protein